PGGAGGDGQQHRGVRRRLVRRGGARRGGARRGGAGRWRGGRGGARSDCSVGGRLGRRSAGGRRVGPGLLGGDHAHDELGDLLGRARAAQGGEELGADQRTGELGEEFQVLVVGAGRGGDRDDQV